LSWLQEREYAAPEDDEWLDAFLERLDRRDAHLRPGIKVSHIWRWKEAADLDERGTLAGEIRDRIAGLLAALGAPLLRACSEERLVTGYG
jgi:hypothetical protein